MKEQELAISMGQSANQARSSGALPDAGLSQLSKPSVITNSSVLVLAALEAEDLSPGRSADCSSIRVSDS